MSKMILLVPARHVRKFAIHPTRFIAYHTNPLCRSRGKGHLKLSAQHFTAAKRILSTLIAKYALRFKFCRKPNCLTNRIRQQAMTSHPFCQSSFSSTFVYRSGFAGQIHFVSSFFSVCNYTSVEKLYFAKSHVNRVFVK